MGYRAKNKLVNSIGLAKAELDRVAALYGPRLQNQSLLRHCFESIHADLTSATQMKITTWFDLAHNDNDFEGESLETNWLEHMAARCPRWQAAELAAKDVGESEAHRLSVILTMRFGAQAHSWQGWQESCSRND